MKSIFQLVFLIILYTFGVSSALQINDSVSAVSVGDALTGDGAFDSTDDTDVDTEKQVVTNTEKDQSFGEGSISGASTKTQTANDNTPYEIYQGITSNTQNKVLEETLDTEAVVKTDTVSELEFETGKEESGSTSAETTGVSGTGDYTVKGKTAGMTNAGYKRDAKTPQQTSVAQTEAQTETKQTGFDGEGFLKAVSKLVNIRKRSGAPSSGASVTTETKSQGTDNSDSTKKPSNNNGDQDDNGDDGGNNQDSFFDKYGIPEYVFWIVVYTVPILVILLLCLTSYCCCCRR